MTMMIQVVADLLLKPTTKSIVSATKSSVSAIVDFVADLSPVSATVVFIASVYRVLEVLQWFSKP